jgi:hypothetical protein
LFDVLEEMAGGVDIRFGARSHRHGRAHCSEIGGDHEPALGSGGRVGDEVGGGAGAGAGGGGGGGGGAVAVGVVEAGAGLLELLGGAVLAAWGGLGEAAAASGVLATTSCCCTITRRMMVGGAGGGVGV